MSQYEKLDYLIVEEIKGGASKFEAINAGAVKEEAERLNNEDQKVRGHAAKPVFRFIDNRLQVLRKRGLIEYGKGRGWIAKDAA